MADDNEISLSRYIKLKGKAAIQAGGLAIQLFLIARAIRMLFVAGSLGTGIWFASKWFLT